MNLETLAVAKIRCLKDTLFFTRFFFKELNNKKYIQGDHHIIIANALDRVFRGECKRLIINIAPRYGKTELAVKSFIAKGLALNPKSKFIHLSYSDKLALDNSETVKEIVKMPIYQQMFSNVKIKKGTDAKEKWYTTEGGGVYAAAAGGQITGFGAGIVDDEGIIDIPEDWFSQSETFGGAIIIDDPIKPEDANSELKRTLVNDRYDSTIANRVNSRNTPIIIIMQRLHTEDLCGHLVDKYKGFEVISLPVIKLDGSALHPHKHTIEELQEMRNNNEFVFDTQYMQDPRPKFGLLFPKGDLNYFKPSDELTNAFETSIAYCDVADEGDDWLCAPLARNIKDKIYIPDVVFSQANTEITIPLTARMLNSNGVKYCRVESNSMGAMFARNLQKEVKSCSILQANSSTNKHTRIIHDSAFIKKYFVFLHPEFQSPEYKKFIDQLCKYLKEGKVKHNDAADACSGLAMFVRSLFPHLY